MGFLSPSSYVANIPGWIALKSIIFVSPFLPPFYSYGFGSAGNEKFKIPPDAELQYEVKLKSFEKVRARDEILKRCRAGGRKGSAA